MRLKKRKDVRRYLMITLRAKPSLNGLHSKRRHWNDAEIGDEGPGKAPLPVAWA